MVARIRLRNHRIHRVFVCARRQFAGLGAVAQHHDAIRDAHHFLDLRRDEQHGGATARQREDLLHEFLFGRDVDAARGLIQDQHARMRGEPARDDGLLLVAARELADGSLDAGSLHAERRHQLLRDLSLLGQRQEFAEPHARLQCERDVFAHRQFGDDAAVLAVLGAEPEAELQRIGGIVELRGLAIDADVARVALVEREQQARELGAPRA